MSFIATLELVVSFLKLRNVDLLQQGLYRVVVSAKSEGGKEVAIPVSILKNDPAGRRGLWQDAALPTHPDKFIDPTTKTAGTRAFFVRFQEQVEVLDEVVCFQLEIDAQHAVRTWGDTVLLTFELWHLSKEDHDKILVEQFQRQLGEGEWESYSDAACASIKKALMKGKRSVEFKHKAMRLRIEVLDDGSMQEAPSEDAALGRPVRATQRATPASVFAKVASKTIPIRNAALPHTEWVPVMWQDWYAAVCQVLVHTSITSLRFQPPTCQQSLAYDVSNRGFADALRSANFTEAAQIEDNEACLRAAADAFQILVSYLVYAYFFVEAWDKSLRPLRPPLRGMLEKLRDRLGNMNKRFIVPRDLLESSKSKTTQPSTKHADPLSKIEVPPPAASTVPAAKHTCAVSRCETFLKLTEPPVAVNLLRPCGFDLLKTGKRVVSRDVMACFSNGLANDANKDVMEFTRLVMGHLVDEYIEAVAEQVKDVNTSIEEMCLQQFNLLCSQISEELSAAWHSLAHEALPKGAPTMMPSAKRAYWRNETVRARCCVSLTPPPIHTTPPSVPLSGAPQPLPTLIKPLEVPPYLPLTFTYPQHTFVEFQLLSMGLPKGTLIGESAPKKKEHTSIRPTLPSNRSEAGYSDDENHRAPPPPPQPLVEKLQGVASGKPSNEVRDPGSVHLIVLCHGYKGNQYDMRALRNHMALSLSVGVEFVVAKSVEDHSDEPIQKLGDLLAQEVVDYIRDENLKVHQLSFIGHSMGGIVVRAALQSKAIESYLSILHTYVSLSCPHLGVADSESVRVNGALWVLSNLRQSVNIKQLRLEHPGLHSLSCTDKVGLFKNVILLASDDDEYVSRQSATLDYEAASLSSLSRKDPHKGEIVDDMLRNMSMHLSLCSNVLRFNVKFHPIGRTELSTAMERAIGKSVHVAFLSNPDFIHTFVCLFRPLFC